MSLKINTHGSIADHTRFVEGIVRGYRNTLLTGQNYGNLTQCETIDGNRTPLILDFASLSLFQMSSYSSRLLMAIFLPPYLQILLPRR